MLHICLNSGKGYTIIHLKLRNIYTIPEEKQKLEKSSLLSSILLGTFLKPQKAAAARKNVPAIVKITVDASPVLGSVTSLPLASLPVNVPSAFTLNPTVSGATTLVVPSVLAITIWLFCVDTIVWPAAVITELLVLQ